MGVDVIDVRGDRSRVGNAGELRTMLESAFRDGGVHLVVVPVDYSENMRVLVHELHSA